MSADQAESADQKLRKAAKRLLSGKPRVTDGKLTKANLHREAGVSRATMNRAKRILEEWDADVARLQSDNPSGVKDAATLAAAAELNAAKREASELRKQVAAAKTIIAMLHEDNRVLRERFHRHSTTRLTDLNSRRRSSSD